MSGIKDSLWYFIVYIPSNILPSLYVLSLDSWPCINPGEMRVKPAVGIKGGRPVCGRLEGEGIYPCVYMYLPE